MKTHALGAGQFVEFILTRECNEAMKMMRTAEIQILDEDMIVAVVICNLRNRPVCQYGGHIELIRFKEYYQMPRGMSTFRLYFRALFGTFFLKVFSEEDCNGKKRSFCRVWM